MELLSIRSSDIAFTMGATGPLLERADNYEGEIKIYWTISTDFSRNPLKHFTLNGIITIQRESTHSKVDAPSLGQWLSLRTPPILWIRQDRHFYFRLLFLLSRKASNATIKLPKDISNANIPMKIEMISKAVIGATSLPMYSGTPVFINSGGYHPVMGTFRRCIVTRRYMNGN